MAASSSIYVGDLNSEVTEANLFDVFREVGPVLSIRVCRDAVTRKSLCYAYVNFQNPVDAQRALDTMNFCKIKNRPCRLMWCKRDPSARKSAKGNVFIKNLAKDIDNKALHDTFSAFGSIVSCKVVTDDDGNSKGYGFVHFQSEDAASEAVTKVNMMLLNGSQVQVAIAEKRDALKKKAESTFTQVFVKYLAHGITDDQFKAYFGKFGEISASYVQRTEKGVAGVGFITYKEHDAAAKAVAEANEKEGDDELIAPKRKLMVCRHQKKNEREKLKLQKQRERMAKYAKFTNLYVKNLADSVTNKDLRESFASFGVLVGANVMRDPSTKASKGFGFVCFKDQEAAQNAMRSLRGSIFHNKPLFVAIAQRKEQRKAQLELFYRSGRAPFTGGPQMTQPNIGIPQQYGGYGTGSRGGGAPRWQSRGGGSRGGGFPGSRGGGYSRGGPRMSRGGIRGGAGIHQGAYMMQPQYGMPQPMGMVGGMGMQMGMMPQMQRPVHIPQQQKVAQGVTPAQAAGHASNIDPARLALMTSEQQKNFLGEKLFSRITESEPGNAAKITGMLLEMDNSEIINLLDSPELLLAKCKEAVDVLQEHQGGK